MGNGPLSARPLASIWLYAGGWWLVQGLLDVAADLRRVETADAGHIWASTAISVALWVPLTVAIAEFCRRVPLRRATWRRSVPAHLLACVAVVVVRALMIAGLDPWVHWYADPPAFSLVLTHSTYSNVTLYCTFAALSHAIYFARAFRERERQGAELRAQLSQAQLTALKAQLQPHFLLNSLQTISELLRRDAAVAEESVLALGRLLNAALMMHEREFVTVADELDFLGDYLALEQTRFGERLVVRWEVAPTGLNATLPPLITQPLVENAIRHGLARREGGEIHVSIHRREGWLQIAIEDHGRHGSSGGAAPTGDQLGHGTGLRNVRARLEAHYGAAARLTLGRRGPAFRVQLDIPAAASDERVVRDQLGMGSAAYAEVRG
ncbi:MAG: hypothetical protein B7733_18100 [Myxococcales bacterium FL481]|nr:MAG: hypothetical protein B7733_18100 [Myxococcales bacterium FL481]